MVTPRMLINTNDLEKGSAPHKRHNQRLETAQNILPSTYQERAVEVKLKQRPWLEALHQFMDPGAEGFAMNLAQRMNHFDIKVIHFPTSKKPESVTKCCTLEEFEEAISEDEERTGTLFIVKGLSRAMIEVLGTRYELEPDFFASHLAGTELYRMGHQESPMLRAPARAPNLLPGYIRTAPFYAVECRRPYHIEGGPQRAFELRATKSSTPRGVQVIHPKLPDFFVFEKISVYMRKGSKVGIILTDQLLSDVLPVSHIASPVTLSSDEAENLGPDGRWHQVSSRRELISWIQRLTLEEGKAMFENPKQLVLRPVLKLVENGGVMFLLHARYLMNRILTRHCDTKFPNSVPFFLFITRSLHRYIHDQKRLVTSALRVASLRGGDDIAEQKQEFGFLADDMDSVLKSLEQDVMFFVGEASIQEGRIVGWVSKFAALFLPVSLLATILSISDPGYAKWATLGGLSVPFVLISIYFMFFWTPAYVDSLMS